MIINTVAEYLQHRKTLESMSAKSRSHGQITVPCMNTLLVARELIVANTYNPNHVSPEKMDLLKQSILDNGFCFPIVTIWDDDGESFTIIDGFHRWLVGGPSYFDLSHLPVVVLPHDITKRMVATVQFNKARGVHQVDLDAEVIRALVEQGLDDSEIAARLGLEEDAVHRYKQVTGVAELFKNTDYSQAWEMVDDGTSPGQ